jgi:hypothetical protein
VAEIEIDMSTVEDLHQCPCRLSQRCAHSQPPLRVEVRFQAEDRQSPRQVPPALQTAVARVTTKGEFDTVEWAHRQIW